MLDFRLPILRRTKALQNFNIVAKQIVFLYHRRHEEYYRNSHKSKSASIIIFEF